MIGFDARGREGKRIFDVLRAAALRRRDLIGRDAQSFDAEVDAIVTPRQCDQRRIAIGPHIRDNGFDAARYILFRVASVLDQRGEGGFEILGACIQAARHQLTPAVLAVFEIMGRARDRRAGLGDVAQGGLYALDRRA